MIITMRRIFRALIAMNIIALFILGISFLTNKPSRSTKTIERFIANPQHIPHKDKYAFVDPEAAYQILKLLDVHGPIDQYYKYPHQPRNYRKPYYGLKNDDAYCDKHRALLAENPEFVFKGTNVIMDYSPRALPRAKVVKVYATDAQPTIGIHLPKKYRTEFLFDIRPDINIFYTNDAMHAKKELDKHFSCLTQSSNHIPGISTLNRKDFAAASVIQYAKLYESKPQCFNYTKFFPETWILRHADQCRDFFYNRFSGAEYEQLKKERTIVYIRKVGAGSHQAKGVQPVNQKEEDIIRKTYGDGEFCGQIRKSTIIQTYIYNPMLLDGHKFDFRIYMVIASTNPIILYYHDGFLRVSLHPYDVNSNDKSVLLTNTALSKKIFDVAKKEGNYEGLTEDELRDFQMWNFTRLHHYLLEKGLTTDQNWVENYLRPEFQKAMIHLVRMGKYPFMQRSQVYELFGVDFMIDTNLNLWFIECNSGPVLSGTSEQKLKFLVKMLNDQFEIAFGLLRSRTKRIINYVNSLIIEGEAKKLSPEQVEIKDLEEKRRMFLEITKNYFEPEFEPSPDNGFVKIIDENLKGTARYSGLIKEECLFDSDM